MGYIKADIVQLSGNVFLRLCKRKEIFKIQESNRIHVSFPYSPFFQQV